MAVHFLNCKVHVDRQQTYLRVLTCKNDENLMRKALPHPFYSLKIQCYFFKATQTVTNTFRLRT